MRRGLVLSGMLLLSCARHDDAETVRADPTVVDAADAVAPEVEDAGPTRPDTEPDAAPEVDAVAPPRVHKLARKQRLALSPGDHGLEGHLDLLEDPDLETDEWGHPAWLDLGLSYEARGGARATLFFKSGLGGKLGTTRFGDAARPSFVLSYTEAWWRGEIERRAIVEVEDGKLLWRHARHRKTGELKPVSTERATGPTGVRSHGAIQASGGGAFEVLQVDCPAIDIMKKPWACESQNRVFWVRGGKWHWDERNGDACAMNSNGSCRPLALPDRSAFPEAGDP